MKILRKCLSALLRTWRNLSKLQHITIVELFIEQGTLAPANLRMTYTLTRVLDQLHVDLRLLKCELPLCCVILSVLRYEVYCWSIEM